MGKLSSTDPRWMHARLWLAATVFLSVMRICAQSADTVLRLPGSVAFDASGDLFFAETASHLIRRLTPAGALSVVAGTGTQGFGGDGGQATAAQLDSPLAVGVDPLANLFIADTHNHRIRTVDANTGVITTYVMAESPIALAFDGSGSLVYADSAVNRIIRIDRGTKTLTYLAGNGVQGYAGDGGPAINASIDTPSGIVFDAAGNLFLCDSRNHRVRRVDGATGVISTVAGMGLEGFGGDGQPASGALLALPRGLALDVPGGLLIADAENQRIRRVDGVSGRIATVAGTGVQGFSGDGAGADLASLDRPFSVGSGLSGVTLTDRSNNRIRQIDASGVIETIAGLGAVIVNRRPTSATLAQTSATALTGSVVASSGTPTGKMTLIDGVTQVASAALVSGSANFPEAQLSTGAHTLRVGYSGDTNFAPSSSGPLVVTVSPPAAADFSLASSGPSAISIAQGGSAAFSFIVTPTSELSSPIVLSASGLPAGATASFSPSVVPPGSAPTGFTLTVGGTAQARLERGSAAVAGLWAAFLFGGWLWSPLGLWRRRRRIPGYGLALLVLLVGCGNRTTAVTGAGTSAVSYNITVSGTATSGSGATLLHSAQVTLTVE